jgi:hypothetical protein
MRDRRLASFEPDSARGIEFITPTRHLHVIREGGAWRIANSPLTADSTSVRNWLDQLGQVEAIDFVDAAAEGAGAAGEATPHGLGSPQIVATVTGARDSLLARVEIGARGPTGLYARSTTQPGIVIVPFAVEEDLTLDLRPPAADPGAAPGYPSHP